MKKRSYEEKTIIVLITLSVIFLCAIIILVIIDVASPGKTCIYTDQMTAIVYENIPNSTRSVSQVNAIIKFMPWIKSILVLSNLDNPSSYNNSSSIPIIVHQDTTLTDSQSAFLKVPEIISNANNPLLHFDIYWFGNSVIPQTTIEPSYLILQTNSRIYFRFFNGIQLAKIITQEIDPMDGNSVPTVVMQLNRITDTLHGTLMDMLSSTNIVYSPHICQLILLTSDEAANTLALGMKPLNKEVFLCVSATEQAAIDYKDDIDLLFQQFG